MDHGQFWLKEQLVIMVLVGYLLGSVWSFQCWVLPPKLPVDRTPLMQPQSKYYMVVSLKLMFVALVPNGQQINFF